MRLKHSGGGPAVGIVTLDVAASGSLSCERLLPVSPLPVAVLASHNGSNLVALHKAALTSGAGYEISLVISNNSDSGALRYARENNLPALHLSRRTHPDPAELDAAMRAALMAHRAGLVVAAGYLRKIGPLTRQQFLDRIINTHPALLPRHGGRGMFGAVVHQAVLDAGESVSGPSVHLVTEEYDTGKVLAQAEVPVLPDDTVESLSARVLGAEHRLLPQIVREIARGERLSIAKAGGPLG